MGAGVLCGPACRSGLQAEEHLGEMGLLPGLLPFLLLLNLFDRPSGDQRPFFCPRASGPRPSLNFIFEVHWGRSYGLSPTHPLLG